MPKVKSFGTLSLVTANKALVQVDLKYKHSDLNSSVVHVRLSDIVGEGSLIEAASSTQAVTYENSHGSCDDLTKLYYTGDYVEFTAKRSGKTHHPWYAYAVKVIAKSESLPPVQANGVIVMTSDEVLAKPSDSVKDQPRTVEVNRHQSQPSSWAVVRTLQGSDCGVVEAVLTEDGFVYPPLVAFNITYLELLVERQNIILKLRLLDPVDRWVHKYAPGVKYRVVSARLSDPGVTAVDVLPGQPKFGSSIRSRLNGKNGEEGSESLSGSISSNCILADAGESNDAFGGSKPIMDLRLLETSGARIPVYGGNCDHSRDHSNTTMFGEISVSQVSIQPTDGNDCRLDYANYRQDTIMSERFPQTDVSCLPTKQDVGIQADVLVTEELHRQIAKVVALVAQRLNEVELADLCQMCPDLMDLALNETTSK